MYISVVMASWNGEKYIEQQLDSLRLQTRIPDEVIISDDASTDHTWEILRKYQKKWPEMPVTLYQNSSNTGYRKNFQRALSCCTEKSTGQDALFMFCDQDDIWLPDKVATVEKLFAHHPETEVLASSFVLIDAEGERLPDRTAKGWSNQHLYHRNVAADALVRVPADDLIYHNFAQGCALTFRPLIRDRFLRNFTDSIPHDWQIAMLGAAEDGLWFYNHPLFQYRIHDSNALGLHADTSGGKINEGYRTIEAELSAAFLLWVRKTFPDIYENDRRMQKAEAFLREDIRCIRERDARGLLRILRSPEYGKLKSKKAALADLASVILPKNSARTRKT